jgi:nucleotide-binding universal stress UspA family protein
VLVVPRKAETEFKNILLATDGSKWSQSAAAEAISIAKRMGSPITAVCVGDNEVKDPSGTVEAVVSQAGKEGVRAEGQVLAGRTYEAIIAAAKKTGADAIVMGKHGRTGFDKIMMGSVTERVIGLSECAVLVVKA